MQIIAAGRGGDVDFRPASPIRADPRAQTVVRPSGLSLDMVPGSPAGLPGGIAMQIVERRGAGTNRHLVDEGNRVRERELQPAAASAAEETAASAEAAAFAAGSAGARAGTFRWRPGRRRALHSPRSAWCPAAGAKAELLADLLDDGGGREARFQPFREVGGGPHGMALGVMKVGRRE